MTLLYVILYFSGSAKAYSIFNTNCTLPETTVNFVSSANIRGSLDIAWNCFATIIACTYSILHLNLPRRTEHVSPTRQRWVKYENSVFTPALLVFIGASCPEWIFAIALMEFWDARYQLSRLKQHLRKSEPDSAVDWNLKHMFFANMGGFVLLYKPDDSENSGTMALTSKLDGNLDSHIQAQKLCSGPNGPSFIEETKDSSPRERFNQFEFEHDLEVGLQDTTKSPDSSQAHNPETIAMSARLAGPWSTHTPAHMPISSKQQQSKQPPDVVNLALDSYQRYHLTAAVLRVAIERRFLPSQAVPEDEICDRAKTDWFTKILATVQLISFYCIVIARVSQDLPVTALEVATSAFAICSVITYAFLYHKPQNAFAPIYLRVFDEIPKEIEALKIRYLQLRLEGKGASESLAAPETAGRYHGRPPFFSVSRSIGGTTS